MTMLNDPWLLEIVAKQRAESLRSEAAGARLASQAAARRDDEAEPTVWREVFPGVEFRPLAAGPEMTIALLRFRRGAVSELHRHASAQAGYVLQGRLRVTMLDQQLTVAAGECYLLPPDVPHQIRAVEPTHVLDFFAPGHVAGSELDEDGVLVCVGARDGVEEAAAKRPVPVPPATRRRPATAGAARPRRRALRGVDPARTSVEPRDAA